MYKQQVELGWIKRPARRQVDETTLKRAEGRDASSHNIWSGRSVDKLGVEERSSLRKKERSLYRCRCVGQVWQGGGTGRGR